MKFNMKNENNINESIREIIKTVESVSYGYVQIIVQDHKVVQIDKLEKARFINKE